ncbi:thiamine transport system substrate-binding protein [Aureimonas altamirensis DSM 21988]|uniref:Thiamine-binding periplasmic protein n=2 Tax=Aureimonas altamirensis TaxID=370622 RepID=A0A0N7KWZ5_9HYPH|nr:thiamine ABC transporter substrate binding subunit [Aureimonas altamirensis]BAT25497.1 periplasmic substrate-binding protein, ABC-type thiamine transporter [Aureimonas altamirensis]SHK02725.1 thiamine transport system substrate-binding protein [Aureimonas altamirensis DSM 21988]
MRTLLLPSLLFATLATAPLSQALGQDAEKPVLTVYTYDSFVPDWGPGPRIETGFEAICGCDLRFVGLDDGVGILNRLRLEGEGTKADVALGMTTDLIPELRATGLFAPSGIDLSTLDLPVAYDDADFVPFDYAPLAFVYDSETVSNVPESFDALIAGPADEKIVIMDPRTSTPGLGLLLWMKAVYGDAAAEKWKALSPRILTVTPGWSEAYGLFTSGEAPIVLSYTTSPAYHMVEEGTERYKAARFSEGQYMQVEIAGVLKTSEHPDLAKAFLEYLVSPEVQSFIPVTNWTLPVVTPSQSLPDAFGKLVSPAKALLIDPEDVAANRQAWTQEWLQAIGR